VREDPAVDEPGTGRLETFSDGVFAIAATLLVLEFSVTSGQDLGNQLLHLWPSYLAYVTSFVTIGIIWMNHHHTVSLIGRIDRTMLFVNNLLLLTVAFLPFPTGLVGKAIQQGHGEQAAALAYAGTLVVMAALHQVWWRYARVNRRLIADETPDSALRAVDRAYLPGLPMYGAVLVLAFFSPLAAVVLTLAIAAFYLPSAALFDR
jgi:TMEM175 potassium channel family protein